MDMHGFKKAPPGMTEIPSFAFERIRKWLSAEGSDNLWISSVSSPGVASAGTLAASYLLPRLLPATGHSSILLAYKCSYGDAGIGDNTMMRALLYQLMQQSNADCKSRLSKILQGADNEFKTYLPVLEEILQGGIQDKKCMIIGLLDGLHHLEASRSKDLSQFLQRLFGIQRQRNIKLLFTTDRPCKTLELSTDGGIRVSVQSRNEVDRRPLRALDASLLNVEPQILCWDLESTPTQGQKDEGHLFDEKSDDVAPGASGHAKNWLSDHDKVLKYLLTARPNMITTGPVEGRVKIAILDTGLHLKTPVLSSLSPDRLEYRSFLKEDAHKPKEMCDVFGHGTHAGSLIYKICPMAKIYVFRVTKNDDEWNDASKQNVADAIRWAIEEKVHIISMSFGFARIVDSIDEAIKEAHAKCIMFAASANGGANRDIAFPAKADEVICISSSDGTGNWSRFNPNGKDVEAGYSTLGEAVESDFPTTDLKNTERKARSGTSFATPIAAGIAGLILDFCTFYFQKLELADREQLIRRLKTKMGMQTALGLILKDERKLTTRYLYPPKLFPTWKKADVEEIVTMRCKKIAELFRDELEKI